MSRLKGKVILIAGGGAIGGASASRYAAEGAAVVLGDADRDAAQATVDAIVATGGRAIATRLDGADADSAAAAVALAISTYGGVDGLLANFATFTDGLLDVDLGELPLDVYDEVMRVNARGYLVCTAKALPAIVARGGGSIVYTSSAAGHIGEPTRVAYAMSKAAGNALMRHVAKRHGKDGVRANAIAPGLIMHPKLEAATGPEFKEMALSHLVIPRRLGEPEDIAAMSTLLMSDEGAYITGQVISVDGGSTMRP